MLFEISGVSVHPLLPPLVAFVISFFTSMGGVSGAFLLLPFQLTFLGYVHPSVSATNQLYNMIAIPGGLYAYWRQQRMLWCLAAAVIAGTLPGVFVGACIRVFFLSDSGHFKLFVAIVLFFIGCRLLYNLTAQGKGATKSSFSRPAKSVSFQNPVKNFSAADAPVNVLRFDLKRLRYSFDGEIFDVSMPAVISLSLIVGAIGGIYGVGGGSIIAPFFVSVLGLPVYTVAGAALLSTFVTSVAGVIIYQGLALLSPASACGPDWLLGIFFGIGGMAGMYCGAALQRSVPAVLIKFLLVVITLFTAASYVLD